jgi:hypothetical protein
MPRTAVAEVYADAFSWAITNPVREEECDSPVFWGDMADEATARAAYAADALAMLDGYRADARNRRAKVLVQEALWRATFGRFDWEGTLDRADSLDGGGVELLDFKSSRDEIDPVPLSMWPQGLTYALALGHAVFRPVGAGPHAPWSPLALKARKLTWVQLRDYIPYVKRGTRRDGTTYQPGDLRGPVYHSVEVTNAMLESHAREIAMFAMAVESGRFPRRPSNNQCTYRCKFTERCRIDFNTELSGLDPAMVRMEVKS